MRVRIQKPCQAPTASLKNFLLKLDLAALAKFVSFLASSYVAAAFF